jgi:hypothetical protein
MMTPETRTQKVLLEIAGTRAGMADAKQFTVEDFQRFLSTNGVDLDEGAIEATLDELCQVRAMEWRATDDIRYRITAWGRMLLARMNRNAAEAA